MRWLPTFAIVAVAFVFLLGGAATESPGQTRFIQDFGERDLDTPLLSGGALAPGGATMPPKYTLQFYDFEPCVPMGWTSVDRTVQTGDYFHVDDFAGVPGYSALAGARSLWCGARPSSGNPLCLYVALPGYGNGWDQAWCTKTCLAVSGDGMLDVSFLARFDSEPGYDATSLEYTLDCSGAVGWTTIDGGYNLWDGTIPAGAFGGGYNVGAGPVKVRLRFQSDGAWSDEDGLWDTFGAVVIDNLQAEGLALEDFEGEAVGATQSNDWITCNSAGCGDFAGIFSGLSLVQEDTPTNLSCMWAFIQGSVNIYACGGFPIQAVVPLQCPDCPVWNEIWSPWIDWNPGGSIPDDGTTHLDFLVYRDLPLDNLVFYTWSIRTREDPSACATQWSNNNLVYYSEGKDWHQHSHDVSSFVPVGASTTRQVQVALGVKDMCAVWGGVFGSGACHSHAPLFDDVEIWRDNTHSWTVADMDLFQDNFAGDGTLTGTVRVDAATGEDAATLRVVEPGVGIADFGAGKAVFCHVRNLPGKSGAPVSGGASWPHVPALSTATWTALQMNATGSANEFDVDLNDQLYVPGDVVEFYFSATDNNALTTYWSQATGMSLDETAVQELPCEMTCLPANPAVDILYVDAFSGHGAEPYFMTAFEQFNTEVDRFDKRSPSSLLGNGLASRVVDPAVQLGGYRKIIWNTGGLVAGGFDAGDYAVLASFVDGLAAPGGLYISGDHAASELFASSEPAAVHLRAAYIAFAVTSDDHRALGLPVSPQVDFVAGGLFDHALGDHLVAFGGGSPPGRFDVLTSLGTASTDMTYGNVPAHGAVVSQVTINPLAQSVGVILSGFSFHHIRDDSPDDVLDRSHHLYDIVTWLQNNPDQPVGTGPPVRRNWLGQNYPNPFNPVTTIEYSIASRAHVSLVIFSPTGAIVRTLVDEEQAASDEIRRVEWNGRDNRGNPVASGVYFYRLSAGAFTRTSKLVLLK